MTSGQLLPLLRLINCRKVLETTLLPWLTQLPCKWCTNFHYNKKAFWRHKHEHLRGALGLHSSVFLTCSVTFFFCILLHIYPPTTRKQSMHYTSLLRSCRPSVYHNKTGESRKVPFPTAQQVNLPACSPHCPFNAERQAGKLWTAIFNVIGLTRLGIKPKSTAPEADALRTRPSELLEFVCHSSRRCYVTSFLAVNLTKQNRNESKQVGNNW